MQGPSAALSMTENQSLTKVFQRACVAAVCLTSTCLLAEPKGNIKSPSVYLGEIVIQDTPIADPVRVPLAAAPSQELTLEIITHQDIEIQRAKTISDALRFTPSFEMRRKGRKNALALNLRGDGNVIVLFDAMPAGVREDYRYMHFLPASLVEGIRVIRDSTSLIYGPPQLSGPNGVTGYGGLIDIRLREPTNEHTGEVRVEGGRYWANTESLHLSGPLTDKVGYVAFVSHDYNDGPGGENMGQEFNDGLVRLVYNYSGDSTLSLTGLHEQGSRELQIADSLSYYSSRLEEYDPWKSTLWTLRLNHVWNDAASTTLEGFYRDLEATLHQCQFGDKEVDIRESNYGVHVRQAIRLPETNVLRIGAYFGRWNTPTGKFYYGTWKVNPKGKLFLDQNPREEEDYSFYAQDEWSVLPDLLTVDAGIRWDRKYIAKGYTADGPGYGIQTNGGVPFEDVWRDPAVSYSLGVRLDLSGRQTVTGRFALSQEATGSDLISSSGAPLDDAEETRYEMGYRMRFNEKLALTLTGFHKQIANGVVYDGRHNVGGTWYPQWRSADFTRIGLEAKAEGDLGHGLAYFANATALRGTVEREGTSGDDPDDRLPRYLCALGLRYEDGPWRTAISAKYTSAYEDDFGTQPRVLHGLGDYWLVNVNVGYTFGDGDLRHEIYGGVRNLANEHYETFPGWRDPGISPYIGYSLKW